MGNDEMLKAAEDAKAEIIDQIDAFIQKVKRSDSDPNSTITMAELEKEWHELNLSTQKSYSDMVGKALSSIDDKELIKSKKASTKKEG